MGTIRRSIAIKEIHSINEYNGQHGTIYYHHLEMENGDKIDIGKKKKMMVGWTIDYEITGDAGQHEFTKAKTAKSEERPTKKDDYTKGIEVGHAINNAVNMICAGVELNIKETSTNEEKIYEYAKTVMAISNRLKNE